MAKKRKEDYADYSALKEARESVAGLSGIVMRVAGILGVLKDTGEETRAALGDWCTEQELNNKGE